MLTAALDGLVARFGLAGERLGEVVAGAVLKHTRDFNLTRECVLGSRLDPHTPAYDIQQACGTGLEAAILVANKIALGPDRRRASPAASTPPRTRRSRSTRTCAGRCCELNRGPHRSATGSGRPAEAAPAPAVPAGDPAQRRAAHRAVDGRARRDHRAAVGHRAARRRTSSRWPRTSGSPPRTSAGFFDDLVTPYLGLTRDQNLRPDTILEKLGALKPVFGTAADAERHDDRRQLLAADRRRVHGAAGHRGVGARSAGCRCWPTSSTRETAAVDFVHGDEGLLMAPAYAVPRLLARNGLTLQDFDFYEIHEAFASQVLATLAAWESPEFCKERLGLDAPLGAIDRDQAQRQRLVAGGRAPVRRDRRPDRGDAGQAARREGSAAAG